MLSHENVHASNSIRTELVLFKNIYEYMHTYEGNKNERRGPELEGEWRGASRSVGREEMEGRDF